MQWKKIDWGFPERQKVKSWCFIDLVDSTWVFDICQSLKDVYKIWIWWFMAHYIKSLITISHLAWLTWLTYILVHTYVAFVFQCIYIYIYIYTYIYIYIYLRLYMYFIYVYVCILYFIYMYVYILYIFKRVTRGGEVSGSHFQK